MIRISSQRKLSLLELLEEIDVNGWKKRVEFEIGDADTPPGKHVHVCDMSRGESGSVPETESLDLSVIEPLAQSLSGSAHVPTVGAAVQGVFRELPNEFHWASEAGRGIQQSICYLGQSEKSF